MRERPVAFPVASEFWSGGVDAAALGESQRQEPTRQGSQKTTRGANARSPLTSATISATSIHPERWYNSRHVGRRGDAAVQCPSCKEACANRQQVLRLLRYGTRPCPPRMRDDRTRFCLAMAVPTRRAGALRSVRPSTIGLSLSSSAHKYRRAARSPWRVPRPTPAVETDAEDRQRQHLRMDAKLHSRRWQFCNGPHRGRLPRSTGWYRCRCEPT